MDFQTIISSLIPYAKYFLFIVPAFIIGFFIYLKLFHKKFQIPLATVLSISFLVCWMVIVFGLTTANRPAMFTGQINTNLFSGYISAWNKWSLVEFQLIIFNMIMFVPLGALIPFIHSKFRSFWLVAVTSFAFTAGIEIFQLISGKGIFELDDLFHNTLGSIAGYFLVMFFILSIEKRKIQWQALGKSLVIPLSFIILLGVGYIAYQTQEYGNLPYEPAQKQAMEDIDVKLNTNLSDKTPNACIYFNKEVNNLEAAKDYSKTIAKQFQLKQQGRMRIEGENRIFPMQDSEGKEYSLVYFLQSGNWSFNADNRVEAPKVDVEKQKQQLENWFLEKELLPANAIYQHQYDTTIRWDIPETHHLESFCKDFSQGFLIVTLSDDKVPNDIMYEIKHNKYKKTEVLISEKQAFDKLQKGAFSLFNPLEKEDALTITDVQLTYSYDTKGYYRPAYKFIGYVNTTENNIEIMINAMEK